ncbi:gliding motility-associated C-terminal domain-containing protein [Mucilaginibacter lutimaris]|uniref:Gliding motility-associated C-terminal domain-containing protein n=1 Tax=Mucilaginibacter lutimaris TaxID=931629 RepID=A0ABW2ZBV6_9SPHI
MPINKLKFLTFLLFLITNVQAFAQVVNGSLGDPVFTFDFGSGNDMKFPTTGYTFVGGSCPEDGKYSISKTEVGCHPDTWHVVLKDHTGNDGYMMVVNADAVPGKEFFSKETTIEGTNAGALCDNTTYEFSAYVLNLIKAGQPGFIEPNITFRVETLSGDIIGMNTEEIHPTYDPNGWGKYGLTFTTPPGVTTVVVRMINNAPGGAGNDFLLDDISFRAYGPVLQAGFAGDISITQNNVCEGLPANYTINATQAAGYNQPKYQWQKNSGNGWADIPGEINTSLNVVFPSAQLGSYQYRLGVAEGSNINSLNCRVYSNVVTINVTSYPAVSNIPPQAVCEGDPITLTATGGATYKWTGPGITSTQNPLVIPSASAANTGTYHVDVTSAAGCITPKDVTVTVNAKPVIQVSGTQTICAGSGAQITASATNGVSYSWSPAAGLSDANSATPFASPSISTLYTVTVTNASNCINTNTVQVNVLPLPVANAGDDKAIFEGQVTKLEGSATGDVATYTWSPADYLDDPHSLTPMANPPHNTTYTLTVTSANNCGEKKDEVFIRVYEKIVIPSSFTPNNDGINDIWNIEALSTYSDGVISIYNRGGKRVYQSRGYGKPWDGKLNGSPLPAGTYYYIIDLKNGTPNLSGWVLIMR